MGQGKLGHFARRGRAFGAPVAETTSHAMRNTLQIKFSTQLGQC